MELLTCLLHGLNSNTVDCSSDQALGPLLGWCLSEISCQAASKHSRGALGLESAIPGHWQIPWSSEPSWACPGGGRLGGSQSFNVIHWLSCFWVEQVSGREGAAPWSVELSFWLCEDCGILRPFLWVPSSLSTPAIPTLNPKLEAFEQGRQRDVVALLLCVLEWSLG